MSCLNELAVEAWVQHGYAHTLFSQQARLPMTRGQRINGVCCLRICSHQGLPLQSSNILQASKGPRAREGAVGSTDVIYALKDHV